MASILKDQRNYIHNWHKVYSKYDINYSQIHCL